MDRRRFLTWSAAGGLSVGFASAFSSDADATDQLSPWIVIGADDRITLMSTALEMGQGSQTGQMQILADELEVDLDAVSVVLSPERDPFLHDGELYSGGSETVRTRYALLREAGAVARQKLLLAAAARWQVPAGECKAYLGTVRHEPSGRSARYGELAESAATVRPTRPPRYKTLAEHRYVGKPIPTLRQSEEVDGTARYGIDVRLPGMLFATLRQCPAFGGKLESVDERPALKIAGVRKVVRLGDAVAVVADSTHTALRAAALLEPRWRVATPPADSADIEQRLRAALDAPDATVVPQVGGAKAKADLRAQYAAAPAQAKLEADYTLAYLAHAAMEPMNATARPSGDGFEIWAPCQAPTSLRAEVAKAMNRPKSAIVVHPQLMGGGFGRRLKGDYAVRAAQVAEVVGSAVQVVWSREEDMTHDFYRPAMHARLRAGLGQGGQLLGYEVLGATADDLTGGSRPLPYAIEGYAATLSRVACGVPVGSWRAVDPGMFLFAKESFIDECAALAGADPLAYRLRMLTKHDRASRVLRAVADAVEWQKKKDPGTGCGLAILEGWDSLVAHCVQVRVREGRVKVERIVVAVDCGLAINPQQVRAQFEGGSLMALSAALGEAMTFSRDGARQRNFDTYRVLRMNAAPAVDVIVLETADAAIGGVGEPPVPGVAPALANAIFAATGKRLRSLPLALSTLG